MEKNSCSTIDEFIDLDKKNIKVKVIIVIKV